MKGIVLTTFNDLDMSSVMWETLKPCLDQSSTLCVVDAGSDDGSVEFWRKLSVEDHRVYVIAKREHKDVKMEHLSVALNVGLNYLHSIGKSYLFWIHADMKFEDSEWMDKMIAHLNRHQDYGKLSPEVYNDSVGCPNIERPGNSCPWLMHVETLLAVAGLRIQKGGNNLLGNHTKDYFEFFNERFVGIGGREDWDLNNQVLDLGKQVMISPCARVWHEGMGTRKRRDTNPEARRNAEIYHSIYGTTAARV